MAAPDTCCLYSALSLALALMVFRSSGGQPSIQFARSPIVLLFSSDCLVASTLPQRFMRWWGVMMSLSQIHCLLVPSTLWYGHPEVARRLMISLSCWRVSFLRWPYLALGLPSYLMSADLICSPHMYLMFSLILAYPSFSPNALVMMLVMPESANHRWAIFVGLSRVITLRASMLCRSSVYRSIGGIQISASIAGIGVFISSPKLFLMILWRVVCASCMRPLVFHSSIL